MAEIIKINDWVQHQRFKVRGQVKKIIRSKKDRLSILKVWTSDQLPLQTWEEAHVTLRQKGDSPPRSLGFIPARIKRVKIRPIQKR